MVRQDRGTFRYYTEPGVSGWDCTGLSQGWFLLPCIICNVVCEKEECKYFRLQRFLLFH